MKNRLSQEKSPYLLQHKDNPVWWYPWGAEAFEAARSENKPIFLSIGYSTCHWCHVMEKDSFEKQDVADLLNKHFISIKVDREERPDVDALYMGAVQAVTGSGGWPMSTFLTTDGKPFWGGTFVPREQFKTILQRVSEVWKTDQNQLLEGGQRLAAYLSEHKDLPEGGAKQVSEKSLLEFENHYRERFDAVNGGFIGAPKFPHAHSVMALLRIYRRTHSTSTLAMATKTLQGMRRGGIYDCVGGGFHRYSVDAQWRIPHFEKMLYDNALISAANLEAFQITKDEEYKATARETFDYVLRDMTDPQGGFYSAEDADSENIEGKFYVWSERELQDILDTGQFKEIKGVFHTSDTGLFEAHTTGDEVTERRNGPPALQGNVLFLSMDFKFSKLQDKKIQGALKKMFETRKIRVRPHLDDKIITSWNALMISSLARGASILGEKYLVAAQRAAAFILEKLRDSNGHLLRTYREGQSRNLGMADDYAYFIESLLDLYEASFDERWFAAALDLQRLQNNLFWDEETGSYFESDGTDNNLFLRNKSYEDNVIPSANSVSSLNLLRLYDLTGEPDFRERALGILKAASYFLENHSHAVPKLLQSVDRLTGESFQVAIVGNLNDKKVQDFLTEFRSGFFPTVTIAAAEKSLPNIPSLLKNRAPLTGEPVFYVCQNQTCDLPVSDPKQALTKLTQ